MFNLNSWVRIQRRGRKYVHIPYDFYGPAEYEALSIRANRIGEPYNGFIFRPNYWSLLN
ncbi:hypothetical protein [Leptolyngbya sp. 'hensonii']|uniref:hypothetical protein n=1 Tax=Leptolyngbya sp. 'hensonii' TaxID=1922337 RepID=UPI000A79D823|nr:hypothetical protein [Leptolyngbya sp. 'hensonii']